MSRRMLLMAVLAAGLGGPSARAEGPDIVIGAGFALSGRLAGYGEDGRAGADLAVAGINARGGVLGRKVRVEYEDTAADRAKAVAVYRRFGARPDVVAMLSLSSIEFAAQDPVANDVKMPLVSIGSATPMTKFSPWSFRVSLIVNKAVGPVFEALKTKRGIKSVGIIYDAADNSSIGQMESVKAAAPGLGLKLKDVESFNSGDQDFSLSLTRFVADPPDVLYVGATTNEATLIISQARALGYKGLLIGGAGLNDPRIAALPGKDAEGVMTFFPFDVTSEAAIVRDFTEQYKAAHKGAAPPSLAALGYDAVLLVADAVRRAGSTDRDAARAALGSTAGFQGVDGSFTYNGPGDNQEQRPFLFELKGGHFARVR